MSKYMEEYMQCIYKKCEAHVPSLCKSRKLRKINTSDIVVPTIHNFEILTQHQYNHAQLKSFVKHYRLKQSGNKNELFERIYCFLYLSKIIIKIQKVYRGLFERKYIKCHGPALKNRSLCTNDTDFFTMDEIASLPNDKFFSYKDTDGFIYGFDIVSFHQLIKKADRYNAPQNPYNRSVIPSYAVDDLKTLIKLSKVLKRPVSLEIVDIVNVMTEEKTLEHRIVDLFHNIDALGHYSSHAWFTNLNRHMLLRFMRELLEIWNYRAQITPETKYAICPPNGDPFRGFNIHVLYLEPELDDVRKYVLSVLEKFINSGIDQDSKSLGAYYVLGALTLVNEDAALSLGWLHDSFSYF
jgi:hypothetical protein